MVLLCRSEEQGAKNAEMQENSQTTQHGVTQGRQETHT